MGIRLFVVWLLVVITACQPMLPATLTSPERHFAGRVEGTIAVTDRQSGLHTQATSAQIDHVEIKLYASDSVAIPSDLTATANQSEPAPAGGAAISLAFSGIPDGHYRLHACAFATSDQSVPISSGGWIASTNTATVVGTTTTYSSGSSFALPLQLADGGIGTIPVTIAGPAGVGWSSTLYAVNSDAKAAYEAPATSFKYYRVEDGTYQVWASVRKAGGLSTVARPSGNTVTVTGPSRNFSNAGNNLDVTITGQVNATTLTVPALTTVTSFEFGAPADIAIDPLSDDLILADGDWVAANASNNRLYKLNLAGNTASVYAGTGTHGYSGDGGAATAAQLSHPGGVATDAAGNVYLADTWNNCVRRIDKASGLISRVAGDPNASAYGDNGLATNASVEAPNDVLVDGAGHLYICQWSKGRVRMVPAANGTYFNIPMTAGNIYTIAGNDATVGGNRAVIGDGGPATAAGLYPWSVAVDIDGNLFVADRDHHKIRKVDFFTGLISTVAGTGTAGYNGDNILGTTAQLNKPTKLVYQGLELFFAEQVRVRKIDAASKVQAVAGDGNFDTVDGPALTARFKGIDGLAFNGAGDLLILDSSSAVVRKLSGGNVSTVAGTGKFGGYPFLFAPTDLAWDTSGNYYLADRQNNRIRKVDAAGNVSLYAGNGFQDWFNQGGYNGDGIAATTAALWSPTAVAWYGGELFVADQQNHRVRKIDSGGTITTYAGTGAAGNGADNVAATACALRNPSALAFDSLGNLYIADRDNHKIRKVTRTSGQIATVIGDGFGAAGAGRYTAEGAAGTSASLNKPAGLAIDAKDNVYVADQDNHRIRMLITRTGTYFGTARTASDLGKVYTITGSGSAGTAGNGGIATAATVESPSGIAVDAGGNLYLADPTNQSVRLIDAGGKINRVAGTGTFFLWGFVDGVQATAAKLFRPNGVKVGPDGALYVVDTGNNRVRRLD